MKSIDYSQRLKPLDYTIEIGLLMRFPRLKLWAIAGIKELFLPLSSFC